MIRVKAKKLGWHNNRRRKVNSEFVLEDLNLDGEVITAEQQFSSKWMEKMEAPKVENPKETTSDTPKKRGRPKKMEDE